MSLEHRNLERILEETAEGILVREPQGRVLFANTSCRRMLADQLELGAEPPNILAITRANGESGEAELSLCPTEWDERSAELITLHDATERQEVARRMQLLATAVEQAHDVVVITRTDGTIEYVNPAFERLTGYSKQEALGANPRMLKSGKHSATDYRQLWDTLTRGEVWTGSLVNRAKDGSLFEEIATISPVRSEDGTTTHYVAVKRNISTQRALEAQLGEASKLEAIGQLAAGIAHEINSPIQYIGDNATFLEQGFTRLLAFALAAEAALDQCPDTAALREQAARSRLAYLSQQIPRAIAQVLEGVGRVSKIVGAMKEFSHPSSGNPSEVDLAQAVETTLTVARNEWKYVAELETSFDPHLPTVPCFRDEINQALLNVLVNAAQAIGAQGAQDGKKGCIRISTRSEPPWAVVRIADSGGGIPPEVRHRIFEPFFTTKEVGKGTGQGLSITYDIVVNKHHGRIEVESEPGTGTTFVLRLPLRGPELATGTHLAIQPEDLS